MVPPISSPGDRGDGPDGHHRHQCLLEALEQSDLEDRAEAGYGDDIVVHLGFWGGEYPYRSQDLEHLCAWDLFQQYDKLTEKEHKKRETAYRKRCRQAEEAGRPQPPPYTSKECRSNVPDNRLFYHIKRTYPKVVYTRSFRADDPAQAEETAQCLLLLFKPWRDETNDLMGDHHSYVQALAAEKDNMPAYLEWLRRKTERERVLEMLLELRNEYYDDLAGEMDGGTQEELEGQQHQALTLGATKVITGQPLADLVASLNTRQKEVYEHVVNHIRHQQLHAYVAESGLPLPPPPAPPPRTLSSIDAEEAVQAFLDDQEEPAVASPIHQVPPISHQILSHLSQNESSQQAPAPASLDGEDLAIEEAVSGFLDASTGSPVVSGSGDRCPWPGCEGQPSPLRSIILGGAGTGKSRLIAAVTGKVNEDFLLPISLKANPVGSRRDRAVLEEHARAAAAAKAEPLRDAVRLCAPTGIAAFLIGGTTAHQSFSIPVQSSRNKAASGELTGDKLKFKKLEFANTKLVVIDELSMMPGKMLLFISQQLQTIKSDHSQWFGGLNILALGDLAQLQPVKASPPYVPVSGDVYGTEIKIPVNMWSKFTVSMLTESMRAATDPAFVDLLADISVGNANDAVLEALDSRRIFARPDDVQKKPDPENAEFIRQKLPAGMDQYRAEDYLSEKELLQGAVEWSYDWEKINPGRECTIIVPQNKQCSEIATIATQLRGIKDLVTIPALDDDISAQDSNPKAKKILVKGMKTSDTAGLPAELKIGIGSRIMIRKNVDDSVGLVNGAMGEVVNFKYNKEGTKVEIINVRLRSTGEVEPVKRQQATFDLHLTSSKTIARSQFPMDIAYAITGHKSQGLTLDCILCDLGMFSGQANQAYVMLSRVRNLADVNIMRIHPGAIVTNADGVNVQNRHRQEAGLPALQPVNDMCFKFAGARELLRGKLSAGLSLPASTVHGHAPTPDPGQGRGGGGRRSRRGRPRGSRSRSRRRGPTSNASRARESTSRSRTSSRRSSRARADRPPSRRGAAASSGAALATSAAAEGEASKGAPANLLPATYQGPHFVPLLNANPMTRCFANSAVQSVASLSFCAERVRESSERGNQIAQGLAVFLSQRGWEGRQPFNLQPLIRRACVGMEPGGPDYYADNNQHDSTAFFGRLLDVIPELQEPFLLQITTKVFCENGCGGPEGRDLPADEKYQIVLERPFQGTVSWTQLINRLLNYDAEPLHCQGCCAEGVNSRHTGQCTLHTHLGTAVLVNIPTERQEIAGQGQYRSCRDTVVTGLDPDNVLITGTRYHVTAAICHTGTQEAGHYWAYVRHPTLPGSWLRKEDERCTITTSLPSGLIGVYGLVLEKGLPPHPMQYQPPPLPRPTDHTDKASTSTQRQQDAQRSKATPLPPPKHLPLRQLRFSSPPQDASSPPGSPTTSHLRPLTWPEWAKTQPMPGKRRRLNTSPDDALNRRILVCKADITALHVGAVVNAAKPSLEGGAGVDGAIDSAAGPRLLAACKAFPKGRNGDRCGPGQVITTPAFNMPATHIFHVVGPDLRIPAEKRKAPALLRATYTAALTEALRLGVHELAFPCISTGVYGFDNGPAADIAASTVRAFLSGPAAETKLNVVFCLFDDKDVKCYPQALSRHFPLS